MRGARGRRRGGLAARIRYWYLGCFPKESARNARPHRRRDAELSIPDSVEMRESVEMSECRVRESVEMRSRDSFLLQYIFDRVMAVGATNKPIAKTHEQAEPADNRAPTSVRPPAVSASIACSRCRCCAAGAPAIHPVRLALADSLRSFFACVALQVCGRLEAAWRSFHHPVPLPPRLPPSLPRWKEHGIILQRRSS